MNKIFRIETSDGQGMYRGPDWDGVWDTGGNSEKHPMSQNDSKLLNENKDLFTSYDDEFFRFEAFDFVFGFSSI